MGRPASRTVLCKGLSEDGVLFFTNYGSDKARHLDAHPYASANFTWLTLARQVIVRGTTERGECSTDAGVLANQASRFTARRVGVVAVSSDRLACRSRRATA